MIFFPDTIIFILLGNLLIDSIIILLIFKLNNLDIKILKKIIYIFLAFVYGFIIDIIFALFLRLLNDLIDIRMYNPFENFKSIMIYLIIILIAGFFIFLFNYFYTFKLLKIEKKYCLKFGLFMEILTAPWLFLMPNF